MSISGRVASVRIQDENYPDDIRTLNSVKLTLTNSRSHPKLIITIPPDEEIELNLNDCTYVEESSSPGDVDCIHNNSDEQTVIIMDKKKQCVDLLNEMRDYLTSPKPPIVPHSSRHHSPSPHHHTPSPHRQSPVPINNENVNDLITALNNGNEADAARIARVLARDKQQVRFALNMINESGKAAPPPKPEPVQEPIKMKLLIESFLVENNNNQPYDVAILPQTTIHGLKQIVEEAADIAPEHQHWYINRDHLGDDYVFDGSKKPRVNEDTTLILYISKP